MTLLPWEKSAPPPPALGAAQLDAMLAETRRLRAGFAATAVHSWNATTAAAELAVQLGHLAQCVRRDIVGEPVPIDEQRPIIDIRDEVADVALAALSVWTLSAPPLRDPDLYQALRTLVAPSPADPSTAMMWLVSASGVLAETAMVDCGFRHRPAGAMPPLATAVAAVLSACLAFSHKLSIDLAGEFARMVRDADGFLSHTEPFPVAG